MRKFLMATVTGPVAACIVHGAAAQTAMPVMPTQVMPTQGQIIAQPNGTPPAGANNGNNNFASASQGGVAKPTPGTVVIHINGRVNAELNGAWTSLDKGTFPAVVSSGATLSPAGNFKIQPVDTSTYARLYTGLDGMAANGLRYGGAIEIRENFTGASASNSSTGASGYSSSETLFVRRAFAYAAGDRAGIVRAGQGDGLISLYDNGVTTFQFLPSMNLQGGDLQTVMPAGTLVPFAFLSGSGAEYANNKLVYMSPQIDGLDVGVQWAPNTSNGFGTGSSGCPYATTGCPGLSASTVALDGSRILNQTAVGVRYAGSFGPVGVLGYGVYEFSGHTHFNGPFVPTASAAALGSSAGTGRYDNLSFGNAGFALTYAGLTIGGNWIGGAVNGQGALEPAGGTGTQGWLAGAVYKLGAFMVGGSFESINSQGAVQLAGISQRHEIGADLGASYVVAPGLTTWIEYLYQQRHQGGFNFASNSAGSSAYNDIKGQGLELGTSVYW